MNARAVALEAVEMVEKGIKVNHRSLIKKHGYSEAVSLNAHKVTQTKSYKAVMLPVLKSIEEERNAIMEAMRGKDKNSEKYATLVASYDVLTKNYQLLSGKATENVAMIIEVSEAIAKKNATHNNDTVKQDSDKQAQ